MWSTPTEHTNPPPPNTHHTTHARCRLLTAVRVCLCAVLAEVEPDYLFAFTSIRRACDAVRSQCERELSIEQQAKDEAEHANAERLHSCQQARDSVASMKKKQTAIQAERSSIHERIAQLEQDITSETEGETSHIDPPYTRV